MWPPGSFLWLFHTLIHRVACPMTVSHHAMFSEGLSEHKEALCIQYLPCGQYTQSTQQLLGRWQGSLQTTEAPHWEIQIENPIVMIPFH